MLPIFGENVLQCFDLTIFLLKIGGNAAHFSATIFYRVLILQSFLLKTGETLPIFLREFFTVFWSPNFSLLTGRNAAHFYARTFYSISIVQFFCYKWGKCCPFFGKNCCRALIITIFLVKNRGKCCPFFCENFGLLFWKEKCKIKTLQYVFARKWAAFPLFLSEKLNNQNAAKVLA